MTHRFYDRGPARAIRDVAVMALIAVTAACARTGQPQGAMSRSPAQRLAHTLGIIRTATPANPKVVKVLFYGQSITSTKWTDLAATQLAKTYPDVRFVIRNMAIGGFSAGLLERTAARDVTEFYPDLIVFHVYGDHRAYERIVRTMRSRTAADIIVETDHVVAPVEPLCPEGLHLALTSLPGCKGILWYRQRNWEDHMSGAVIPELADKYDLAIEPRRRWWNAYLTSTHRQPMSLIADEVHPNDAGWRLAAGIFEHWFDRVVASWHGERSNLVATLPLPAGGRIRRYTFVGDRVEVIATDALKSKVSAVIDGKAPTDLDGCWQDSRTTALPGVPTWPAIRQIGTDNGFHRAERWTVTLHELGTSQDRFRFDLAGVATGFDGIGKADQDFTSTSGRIHIAARDWVVPDGLRLKGKRVSEGFKVRWDRHFVCTDQSPVALDRVRNEVRFVVATGLGEGSHSLALRLAPSAAAYEIRVYRPPLAASAP